MLPLRETPFLLPPPKPSAWSGKGSAEDGYYFRARLWKNPRVYCMVLMQFFLHFPGY